MKKHVDNLLGIKLLSSELSCGMKFNFMPLPKEVKLSMFHLYTRFGSIDALFKTPSGKEIEIEDGTAHFLEHCAFYDPKGKDAAEWFQLKGLYTNAWTNFDHTTYYFHSPYDNNKKFLDYLISFVSTPFLTEEVVKKEQGVITQEIAKYKDKPERVMREILRIALYQKHPFRRSIGGNKETIMRITAGDLNSSYNTFYSPSNLNLVIFSPVKENEEQEADKYFRIAEDICSSKGFEYKAPPDYVYIDEPEEPLKRKIIGNHKVPEPNLIIGFKGVMNMDNPESRLKSSIINDILAESIFTDSSEAVQKIVEQKLVRGNSFFGYHFSGRSYGNFSMGGSTSNPEALKEGIVKMLKEQVNGSLSKELVELNKKKSIKDMAKLLELEEPVYLAHHIIPDLAAGLNPVKRMETLLSVTYEDVLEAGKKYLDTDNYSVAVLYPEEQ